MDLRRENTSSPRCKNLCAGEFSSNNRKYLQKNWTIQFAEDLFGIKTLLPWREVIRVRKSLKNTLRLNLPFVLFRVSLALPNQDSVVVMLWVGLISVVVTSCTAWPGPWPGPWPGAWVSPGVMTVWVAGNGSWLGRPGACPGTWVSPGVTTVGTTGNGCWPVCAPWDVCVAGWGCNGGVAPTG